SAAVGLPRAGDGLPVRRGGLRNHKDVGPRMGRGMEACAMRQRPRGRVVALGSWLVLAALLAAAPGTPKKKVDAPPLKVEETIADLADIRSNGDLRVEGVGLVVGLDDTGSDPEPSHY